MNVRSPSIWRALGRKVNLKSAMHTLGLKLTYCSYPTLAYLGVLVSSEHDNFSLQKKLGKVDVIDLPCYNVK